MTEKLRSLILWVAACLMLTTTCLAQQVPIPKTAAEVPAPRPALP